MADRERPMYEADFAALGTGGAEANIEYMR